MTAPFHAHSVAGRPEAEWELLRVHLREVAEEAGRPLGRADDAGRQSAGGGADMANFHAHSVAGRAASGGDLDDIIWRICDPANAGDAAMFIDSDVSRHPTG